MRPCRIIVNTRVLGASLTGVQRYAAEILSRLGEGVERVAPPAPLHGVRGHLWEQIALPRRVGAACLWSPGNTGPLATRRQVVTIHDMVPADHPEWLSPRFAAWYRFVQPRLAARVSHLLTVSEFTRERIVEVFGVPAERVTVVPNGVDERFLAPGEGAVRRAREALGLAEGRYVLSLGSLEPRKNLGRLLEAWRLARPSLPDDVQLVIAGRAGGRRVFGNFAIGALPPGVRLTGHVDDEHLPGLYAGALAFAYPSLYEGFGLPLLEAMAAGVPTLAGDRTSLPEVVGDAGLLVDPFDVEALADGLTRLVNDAALREELRARGSARARGFTWPVAAEGVRRVLERAARGEG